MTACPNHRVLQQFLRSELEEGASRIIDAHLRSCAECRSRAEELVRLPAAARELSAPGDGRPEGAASTYISSPTGEYVPAEDAAPVVPGYEVLGELGHGGMGVVYRARDVRLRREVAVKVLAAQFAEEPQVRRRFLEEAHIAGQLQHPGMPAVHELGELPDGRPFLAMKLIKGRTLAEMLRQREGPEEGLPGLLQAFAQVCQAVAYAHSKGVIHRDLKPSNVMVGEFGEVQVMDWGLAKALGAGGLAAEGDGGRPAAAIESPREEGPDWQTEGAVGTWAYMPPEQARGQAERVGARSDVFALGAVLCEMMTGRPPYAGGREAARQQAEAADLVPALDRLAGCGADGELVGLTRACLAAEPGDRPADAAKVAVAVAAHLAQVQEKLRRAELARAAEAARAEEARAKVVAERRARRLQLGLGATALVALVLGVGGGWLWQKGKADLRGDVEAAVRTAADHRDAYRFDEAEQSLAYARRRLGTGGPPDLHQQLDQADAAWKLARTVDAIRLRKATVVAGKLNNAEAADREYAEAFRQAGLGSPGDDVEAVAARVRRSSIRGHLLAALDDWAAGTTDRGRLGWLLGVARQADDPRYARFRDLEAWASLRTLRQRAREAVQENVPPALLAGMTVGLGASPEDLALVRASVSRNPTNFWAHFSLANALLRGSPKEAVGFYWAALALRPRTAAVYNNLSVALYTSGDLHGAIAASREAVECDSTLPHAHINLAAALHATKDVKGAVAASRRAVKCGPTFAQAHNNLGVTLRDAGDLKGAVAAGRRAVECDPTFALAHYNLGNALRASGDLPGAVTAYGRAIKYAPEDARFHNGLGGALSDLKDLKGAVAAYRRAIGCDASHAPAHLNLGVALYDSGDSRGAAASFLRAIELSPEDARGYFNLGNALRRSGDLKGAADAYRRATEYDPTDAQAHLNLGGALSGLKDLKGAIAAYRRATECDPRFALAHTNLGVALQEAGDLRAAAAAHREAIRWDSRLSQAHFNLGVTLGDLKDPTGAIAAFRRAAECDPRDAKPHYNLGNVLHDRGDPKGAIECYRQAIKRDPKFTQAHYNLGNALRRSGDLKGAIAAFRQAVECDPKLALAHTNLGNALAADRDLAGALAAHRRAVECAPQFALAHLNLGATLHANGDRQGAIAAFRRATALDPTNAQAHTNLGVALFETGDLQGALVSHRRAVDCDPRHARAHTNLGVALRASGDLAGAIAAFRRATQCDPRYTQAHGALGESLRDAGRFAEAVSATRRALQLLPVGHRLRLPVSRQLQQCEALLALDGRLSAVLQGERKPANAAELLALAELCARYKKRHAAAARFYADAFAAQPGIAADLRQQHRYNAACAAALAAAGEGSDDATLGERERRFWRAQAHAWLRADLAAWAAALDAGATQARQNVARTLAHWQKDLDFASVREPAALAWLPPAEALAWAQLWDEVDRLMRRAQGGNR